MQHPFLSNLASGKAGFAELFSFLDMTLLDAAAGDLERLDDPERVLDRERDRLDAVVVMVLC